LGSAIFAFLAAKAFASIEEAQRALCPPHRVFDPQPETAGIYSKLFSMYRSLYFGFGQHGSAAVPIGDVLPNLRAIAAGVRNQNATATA
jgi:L-ribulokinase